MGYVTSLCRWGKQEDAIRVLQENVTDVAENADLVRAMLKHGTEMGLFEFSEYIFERLRLAGILRSDDFEAMMGIMRCSLFCCCA